jgi:hypothetical protein
MLVDCADGYVKYAWGGDGIWVLGKRIGTTIAEGVDGVE